MYFASGKKIIVNGILNTWGTATENVTFDRIGATGSWGGIVYNSGSSGTLNWSIITNVQTYGGAAIVINGSSPTIQNCTIENNVGATSGIQVLSNGQPYIYNNIIRNNPEHGIYISHSNPYLRYNMITGSTSANKASVYCYNFASPLFGGVGGGLSEGKNTLQSGYYGIVADYYSTPSAGASDIAYNNRFINNSCANAYANYYSTIYARYDWWGSSTPDPNKIISVNGSTIYWDPSLTSDPGPSRSMLSTPYSNNETLPTGLSFSINNSGSPNNTEIQQSVVFDDLLKARELRFTKNYNEAFNIYKSILSSKKEMSEAKIALVELGNIYAETKDLKILTFIKGFIQTKYDFNGLKPIAMEALSKIYTSENNINEAIEINTQLINDYNGTIHERSGGMNLFFIYYNSGKFDLSKEMLSSVKTKFENNTEMEAAEWLLYVAGVYDAKPDLSKVITINQNQESIKNSTDYQLFDNYPNPFNPTTKISYHLPEASFVTLKVFDILGREIVTLVNEAKPSGKHEVEFDASKLPSGTYIYQLTAGNNQIIRKMLLIK
ncbi:MAG: T9SS type A sorting domain-containing protein [Stygiobacter sp.]